MMEVYCFEIMEMRSHMIKEAMEKSLLLLVLGEVEENNGLIVLKVQCGTKVLGQTFVVYNTALRRYF